MNLFLNLAVKLKHVHYLGLIVPVPVEYIKNGYLAADQSGDIWAFESIPKPESNSGTGLDQWNNGSDAAAHIIHGDFFEELSESGWFLENWANTCIKISDLPLVD